MKKTISFILIIMMLFSMTTAAFAEAENSGVEVAFLDGLQNELQRMKDDLNNLVKAIGDKFSDMRNHWSVEWVAGLEGLGIIAGYVDGTFRPDASITRAEFTKILVTALHDDPGVNSSGHWADNYMNIAIREGYVNRGEFDNIDKNITRGEMARMIVRAIDERYPNNINEYKGQIRDFNNTSRSFQDYVLKAYVAGIISGYPDGTFRYDASATRAEASTMIIRMLDEGKRQIPELKDEVENDIDFIEPEFEILEKNDFGIIVPSVLITNYHDYDERYSFRGYFHSPYELNFPTRRNLMDFYNDDAIFSLDITKTIFEPYIVGRPINQWSTVVDMYNTEAPDHISPEIKMSDIDIVEFKIEIKKETENGEVIKEYIVSAKIE